MVYYPVKHILLPIKKGVDYFARTHNMNLYQGCIHGCIYCDSRSTCYQIPDFDVVRGKENALEILEKELSRKRDTGIVGTGAMSDPYNPFETREKLTHGALQLISRYRFGVSVTTKSASVTEDIELFERISRYAPAEVGLTITTMDDALCGKLEPNAPPTSQRWGALSRLAQAGLFCGVHLNPVLPFLTDSKENILSIVRETARRGGKYVLCYFGVTMREGNREYFYAKLDKDFPGMKQQYIRAFGDAYVCPSPHAQVLYAKFVEECKQLGLLYRLRDISSAIRERKPERQIRFF